MTGPQTPGADASTASTGASEADAVEPRDVGRGASDETAVLAPGSAPVTTALSGSTSSSSAGEADPSAAPAAPVDLPRPSEEPGHAGRPGEESTVGQDTGTESPAEAHPSDEAAGDALSPAVAGHADVTEPQPEDGRRTDVHDGPHPTTPPTTTPPTTAPGPTTPWRRLMAACTPKMSRAQLLAAVLCAVLGFALVVQLRQTRQDEFTNLRQSDLVRILDDVTRRSEDLDRELSSLLKTEFELRSGTDSSRAALELAEQDAATQGILSGRLPAEGPGIEITIVEGTSKVSALRMFNILEELRNAGAEVVEVNGIRMVTSSYFDDATRGVVIDGIASSAPYRWTVIGDPLTLQPAMEIPGGALPTIRVEGGRATIEARDRVEVKAVHEPEEPEFASPGVDAG